MAPNSNTAHFSLAWEKYREVMCDGFSSLQQNGEFVDMTIAADGHLVKVHQMVVGLASPFLKQLIKSAPCPHPVIFLNNVSHQVLSSILEYVYTGEVAVAADKLSLFVETAKALHIKGLEDMLQVETVEAAGPVDTPMYEVEPIQVITKPGIRTLQLQVVGDSTEVMLPSTARNIVMKRDMPVISPVPEKKSMLETPTKIIKDMDYMDDDPGDVGVDVDSDDNTTSPLTSTDDSKLIKITSPADKQSSKQKSDLQYTVSNRGALQLILNRYMYNLVSRSRNGRMRRWKCVDYRNQKCPATATTEDNVVSSRVAMHNHAFHDKRILAKIQKNAVFSAISKAEEASLSTEEMIDD